MHTATSRLMSRVIYSQGICTKWLASCNRVLLSALLFFTVQSVESVLAADVDIQETQMGEALMQMDEQGETAAPTLAPPPTTSEGWRTCDVKRVGPGWGNVYLRLVCNGVSERWFIARKDQEKDMLAAGLTAITLNKKVSVYLAHMPSGYHEVRACYVLQ